jgi:hypothetical protein
MNWLGQININCDISNPLYAAPLCFWNEKQGRQFVIENRPTIKANDDAPSLGGI